MPSNISRLFGPIWNTMNTLCSLQNERAGAWKKAKLQLLELNAHSQPSHPCWCNVVRIIHACSEIWLWFCTIRTVSSFKLKDIFVITCNHSSNKKLYSNSTLDILCRPFAAPAANAQHWASQLSSPPCFHRAEGHNSLGRARVDRWEPKVHLQLYDGLRMYREQNAPSAPSGSRIV